MSQNQQIAADVKRCKGTPQMPDCPHEAVIDGCCGPCAVIYIAVIAKLAKMLTRKQRIARLVEIYVKTGYRSSTMAKFSTEIVEAMRLADKAVR